MIRSTIGPSRLAAVRSLLTEGRTHAEIARELGLSRPRVTNLARIANLPAVVIDWVDARRLSPKHAEALAALSPEKAEFWARESLAHGWTASKLWAAVHRKSAQTGTAAENPNVRYLADQLGQHLGTRVSIRLKADGSGELALWFSDQDVLEGLIERTGFRFD